MRFTSIILSSILIATTSAIDLSSYTFEQYISEYNKPYEPNTSEWNKRLEIFTANIQTIVSHNALEDEDISHMLGVNDFTDMEAHELHMGYAKSLHPAWSSSEEEGEVMKSSRRLSGHQMELPFQVEPISKLPLSVDWREKGVVSPVKSQGGCGSCWAFASIAALESHVAIASNKLISFSEQQLVSCVQNIKHCGGSGGCGGATAEVAYDYIVSQGGIAAEETFPYHADDRKCPIEQQQDVSSLLRGASAAAVRVSMEGATGFQEAVATIDGYADTPTNDYLSLMNAVAKSGPVVIAVAASTWMMYGGGVFSLSNHAKSSKSAYELNHGVVVVGYGTDQESGKDYWIVRNSWGPRWGTYLCRNKIQIHCTSNIDFL